MAFFGGKIKVIILNPDMTFTEKKVSSEGTELNIDKDYKPNFSMGTSVFKELIPRWKEFLGKSPRNLVILLDQAMRTFELKSKLGRGAKGKKIEPNYWTRKERKKFIAKVVAKQRAQQKMISTTQFFVLAGIGLIAIVLQIIILTRTPIMVG